MAASTPAVLCRDLRSRKQPRTGLDSDLQLPCFSLAAKHNAELQLAAV